MLRNDMSEWQHGSLTPNSPSVQAMPYGVVDTIFQPNESSRQNNIPTMETATKKQRVRMNAGRSISK
jgi:hypothetical protein